MSTAMPLLRAERVSKRFGNVTALDDVSLDVVAGRVTCLLGDNGAGKSTLIRILSGVHAPTSGRCLFDGDPVTFDSPRAALDRGIATVHQDLALIPLLSVWRNFFLGIEPTRGFGPWRRLDVKLCRERTRQVLADLGINLNEPDQPVGTLSGGERQCVAIGRAIHLGARVLILDEPTAALGVRQAELVLDLLRRARDRNIGVLLITHSPAHAANVGDHFVVLQHGRVLAQHSRDEVTLEQLVRLMSATAEA